MSGKRGISNVNASLNSTKAAKELPNSKRPKGSPGKKTKQQEPPPVSQETDHTLSDFLLLQAAPASGSEPSSSAVTLPPTVVHGAQPAPETAADTDAGITSAEDGRRHSERIANATAKSGGGNETQGASSVNDVPEDDDEDKDGSEGRTPTKPFAVAEKRGRGRPFKSPSQQGLCAALDRPFPNPNTFYP